MSTLFCLFYSRNERASETRIEIWAARLSDRQQDTYHSPGLFSHDDVAGASPAISSHNSPWPRKLMRVSVGHVLHTTEHSGTGRSVYV